MLLVNNYRDLQSDRKAGKLTLAHYLGSRGSHDLLCRAGTGAFPAAAGASGGCVWLVLLALPLALLLFRRFVSETPGPAFNQILARTALLQLLYGVLLSAALLL